MNKKNYGTTPYYDFLPNQRQVCTILILSISSIFFIAYRINKTASHQKNYNLNTGQTNNTSSFQYIPADCGSHTPVKACGINALLTADPSQPNYKWSTNENTQSITVTASGTYWWETIDMANNQVRNGNFSFGNNGDFTSDYGYIATPSCHCGSVLTPEGLYTITTNPNFAHSGFTSTIRDHTTGSGNMMVVNGGSSSTSYIWKESIIVTPNTDYIFSIWFISVSPGNPGKLDFSINGTALNAPILLSSTGGWKNFTTTWNSGTNTTANIGILNQNTDPNGNDFAIDDIVFAPVCRKYFDVTLTDYPTKPSITPL